MATAAGMAEHGSARRSSGGVYGTICSRTLSCVNTSSLEELFPDLQVQVDFPRRAGCAGRCDTVHYPAHARRLSGKFFCGGTFSRRIGHPSQMGDAVQHAHAQISVGGAAVSRYDSHNRRTQPFIRDGRILSHPHASRKPSKQFTPVDRLIVLLRTASVVPCYETRGRAGTLFFRAWTNISDRMMAQTISRTVIATMLSGATIPR